MEVNGQLHAPAALSSAPGTPSIGGWVDTRVGLDTGVAWRKNPCH